MATAYHLEALRRQRLIDRTVQAKRKLEEVSVGEKYCAVLRGCNINFTCTPPY